MRFATVRHTLFTIHMWVGLILGAFIMVLSLSGAILVYDDKIADFFNAPPSATTAGQRLPLSMIAASARSAAEARGIMVHQTQIVLPEAPEDAAIVRFTGDMGVRPGMAMGNGMQVYVDPVSGQVLGVRPAGLIPVFAFLHRLHGSFAIGRDVGRPFVGWLGVSLLVLGISGLVLWWPRRGQWKYAFIVRSTATGLRFHRELHAAVGIWIFIVFMAVSFSGVAISFPQAMRAILAPASPAPKPAFNLREGPKVVPLPVERMVSPDQAALIAQKTLPGLPLRSVTLPSRPDRTIAVALVSGGKTNAMVYVDPYRGTVAAARDPAQVPGIESFMAFQRPVHDGQGFGPAWEFLVFLSGLAPTLFMVTGVTMWLKKRKRHVPMTTMTEDVVAQDED